MKNTVAIVIIILVVFRYTPVTVGRQDHCGWGIIHQNDDLALKKTRRCSIRAFRIFEFWKRIEPLSFKQGFRQTLLVHPQIAKLQAFNTLFQIVKQFPVDPV